MSQVDKLVVFAAQAALLPNSSEPSRPTPVTIEADPKTGLITALHPEFRPCSAYGPEYSYHEVPNGCLLFPGLIDAHVHLNDPGRSDWEGFETGTNAAASGGVTTLIDMPLNSLPPTTTVSNLNCKLEAAKGRCRVDVGFWGGVIPGNEDDLIPLAKAGVKGFKCFLIDSGVDEFPHVSRTDLERSMPKLEEAESVLLFHAELDCPTTHHAHRHREGNSKKKEDPNLYSTFLNSRSSLYETDAIALVVEMNRLCPNLRTHIVHLSAADALPILNSGRAENLPISVETCFHYLTLSAASIPDGQPEFKCCPPIRTTENQDRLWTALLNNEIDYLVSDHSPCTIDLKANKTLMEAWGGIGGLGLGLSLIWTEAKRRQIKDLESWILKWLCERPAQQVRVDNLKGKIQVGSHCDLCIFDPSQSFEVTASELQFKNKISPYVGMKLTGRVTRTILRTQTVFDIERHGFGGIENVRDGRLLI